VIGPTPTPTVCTALTNRTTYLRATPDPNGQKLQLLQPNSTVNVSGRLMDKTWVQAEYQGQTGWLFVPNNITPGCDLAIVPAVGPEAPVPLVAAGAFSFTTGVGAQAVCKDVPASGLLVQGPGEQKIKFRANGVDVTAEGTILLSAQAGKSMTADVIEGQAWFLAAGHDQTAKTGQNISVPLGGASGAANATAAATQTSGVNTQVSGPPNPAQASRTNTPERKAACALAKAAGLDAPC
jgi:hypothetical protein